MDAASSLRHTRHHSARRAARERVLRTRAALHASAAALAVALAAGFVWGKGWWHTRPEDATREVATPAQRAEALSLLERAIKARQADLINEAMRLAMQAKTADPDVPGADLFAAEMALCEGSTEIAEKAAREALMQEQYAADARLILALNAWTLRGQSGIGSAGADARQLLAEAADAELSNGAVRFFAGDLERAVGRPFEAHLGLLGGLYRQQLWHSAALLSAKLALTVDQAGGAGGAALLDVDEESANFGTVAAALARSQNAAADTAAANEARAAFTRKHFELLVGDTTLAAWATSKQHPGNFLPFGEVAPPAIEKESVYVMPWEQEPKLLDNNQFRLPSNPLSSP